jgi:3-oxoacyl-[acyl-carrier protein] reductase
MNRSFSLAGHTALVTGNSTGIGKAIGMALGIAGAKVPVNFCNNEARAADTLQEYRSAGIETRLVRADVTNEQSVNELLEQVRRELGPVDILVCNATCHHEQLPLEQYDWPYYQRMIDFFVKSPYLLTRGILPFVKSKKWGRIINVTSEVFHASVSPFSAYVAAKGGQIGWSRTVAKELAPFGITVNCVAPGWVPVERHQDVPQWQKDAYLATIPVGRWGKPSDVANAVVYLSSDEASFVTGQTICVNGGMTPR